MRIGISVWRGRISPVMDTAGALMVVDIDERVETQRHRQQLSADDSVRKAAEISGLGIDILLCGAISRRMESALTVAGVHAIPRLCGDVEHVLAAFFDDRLADDEFQMPGCGGRGMRRRFCGRGGGAGRRGRAGRGGGMGPCGGIGSRP